MENYVLRRVFCIHASRTNYKFYCPEIGSALITTIVIRRTFLAFKKKSGEKNSIGSFYLFCFGFFFFYIRHKHRVLMHTIILDIIMLRGAEHSYERNSSTQRSWRFSYSEIHPAAVMPRRPPVEASRNRSIFINGQGVEYSFIFLYYTHTHSYIYIHVSNVRFFFFSVYRSTCYTDRCIVILLSETIANDRKSVLENHIYHIVCAYTCVDR